MDICLLRPIYEREVGFHDLRIDVFCPEMRDGYRCNMDWDGGAMLARTQQVS